MKKITIFILVLGILGGASFLKVFTVTLNENIVVAIGRPDFSVMSPDEIANYDGRVMQELEVPRKGNFWEFIRN